MAKKFSLDNIPGYGEEERKHDNEKIINIVDGLLNSASKSQKLMMKLEYVERRLIDKNPNNRYSIEDIDELKWSIREMGLLQPLHVMKTDDERYRLLGGERRLTAIDMLIADEEVPNWNEDTLIPCVVTNPETIKLPLNTDSKERLSILATNKEARVYTNKDKLMEIREWKEIISELRENGVESIPGGMGEVAVKGRRSREIIVDVTGMSNGQIGKLERIDSKGSDLLLEAFENEELSLGIASDAVTRLTKDEQDELVRRIRVEKRVASKQDVDEIKNENKIKGRILLSKARLKNDWLRIKKSAGGDCYLAEESFDKYALMVEAIVSLLNDSK